MNSVIKVLFMCFLSMAVSNAYAATINGSFGIGGAFTATGTDLSDVTDISLSTVFGVDGTGDTDDVTFFSTGLGGSTESLTLALTGTNFLTIEGWSFELTSLNVVDQNSGLLTLDGTGILTGIDFDPTDAIWTFSASSLNGYSMSIATTVVPVPAAVWLFGSGLLGLVGIARRKA
ncbi:hypothetical protein MNBD_GAMMA06-552 [hydrothermal vent metagenome]|uniref:PEP-CTERM protein-sorting domain-containing protein n=1 Tax=hydrothermal vent metagenome TaxID=652676 RepID=A0A3B0WUA1_9ZZZZ